jgi:chemotaxis protein MotB
MALARSRRERGIDYWPGFVDALSTLILGIVFLLSVFVIVQFFLSRKSPARTPRWPGSTRSSRS